MTFLASVASGVRITMHFILGSAVRGLTVFQTAIVTDEDRRRMA